MVEKSRGSRISSRPSAAVHFARPSRRSIWKLVRAFPAAGFFAAGDVRVNAARQVVTSAGDGATAAIRADHYITDIFG